MSKKFSNTPRGTGRVLTLVSLISAAFGATAQVAPLQDQQTLAPVVVSASRFPNDPAFAPIGAIVITADEIRESGASDINDAIRKIGGVHARQNLAGTKDYSLDLRGFGEASDRNIVVLVDGVRMNEIGLGVAAFSSIPLDSVERIEIVRGGSSVLYGEGATGGTIHIITKKGAANAVTGSIVGEVGNFNHRELRAFVSKGWDQFSVTLNASKAKADNYRDNNETDQENFNGGLHWRTPETKLGLRVDVARNKARMPGDLTLAEFRQNPRQATTPNDWATQDVDRYTLYAERRLGNVELTAELAHTDKSSEGAGAGDFSRYELASKGSTTQFSPRARHLQDFAGGRNEFVIGMDFSRWDYRMDGVAEYFGIGVFPYDADNRQKSQAIYIRDEIRIGKARVAAGARQERFERLFVSSGLKTEDASQTLRAWELQSSYDFSTNQVAFVKIGKSYRVATADETYPTALRPQTSRDMEVGTTIGGGQRNLTIRAFQHRLRDEIAYDPTVPPVGANINLDPTKRQGIELEGSMRLATSLRVAANVQHMSAKFTEGLHSGKYVPLVPRNTAAMKAYWQPAGNHSVYAGVQWVDSQYFGGDLDNACGARIPSYTTLDARYAIRTGAWEFALSGTNLTNKDYFSYGFSQTNCTILGGYPDSGRQLKFSIRRDF